MLYFISKKSVTIASVRKSFFAATNCNKIVTKSILFTLLQVIKVMTSILSKVYQELPPQSYNYYKLMFLIIKNEYKTITKNECKKSLLKTNVKTIIKMNIRSLL